jgi:hypothetical protein
VDLELEFKTLTKEVKLWLDNESRKLWLVCPLIPCLSLQNWKSDLCYLLEVSEVYVLAVLPDLFIHFQTTDCTEHPTNTGNLPLDLFGIQSIPNKVLLPIRPKTKQIIQFLRRKYAELALRV